MLEIDIYDKIKEPLAMVKFLGDSFAKSGLFGCENMEQGYVLAYHCYVKRMSPIELLSKYDIVDGKLRKKAVACLAEWRLKGVKHKWLETGDDSDQASAEFIFEGNTLVVKFTMEQAKKQGLVRPNSNWVKTPGNMLRARVITNAVGMLCPEIISDTEPEDDRQTQPPPELTLLSASQTSTATGMLPPAETEKVKLTLQPPPAVDVVLPRARRVQPAPEVVEPEAPTVLEPEAPAQTIEPEQSAPSPVEPALEQAPEVLEPESPAPVAPPPAATAPPKPPPLLPPEKLPMEMVEEMGRIFAGSFARVANWMIKEGWIPASAKPLSTEQQAAFHLQQTLPGLTRARAKRVLTRKMMFMRATEEIAP